jgi:uncharacterized YigZ family protein
MNEFTYKTITQSTEAEFKDRGSRFIAYAYPVENVNQIKQHLKSLKEQHPKAVHHCLAWRLGYDQNLFRASDDGEPSGSAGKPILGQIDSLELTNCLIIVVRYFGGVLLGVPGLINAYKTSALLSLEKNSIVTRNKEVNYKLEFDYTLMNEVMRVVKQYDLTIKKQEMQLFCMTRARHSHSQITTPF